MLNHVFMNAIRPFIKPANNVKVVILGHQKSGTTALAALLAKATGLEASIDPLFHIDKGKAEVVARLVASPKYINWLCLRYPRLFGQELVKDPDLIFIYPQLKKLYQNARYVFIARDPRDTIRSICNRLALSGDDLNNCPKISQMKRGNNHWRLILSGQLPELEINDPAQGLVYHLAQRWNYAVEVYLNNADEMALFRYEEFLQAKERSVTEMAELLNLASIYRIGDLVDVQYQPKGDPGLDWTDFFGEKNLGIIEDVCANSMRVLDYRATKRNTWQGL